MTRRVTILGGGPAGLSTAFDLTDPEAGGAFDVTIYQLGWRNGGLCASGRVAPEWWVNQNGTHYLFGCYHDALYLLRRAYDVLEANGDSRFGTFEEQLVPRSMVVMKQQWAGAWTDWVVHFPTNLDRLGRKREPTSTRALFRQMVRNVLQFVLGPTFQELLRGKGPASWVARGFQTVAVAAITVAAAEAHRVFESSFPFGTGALGWAARHAVELALISLRAAIALVLVPLATLDLAALRAWILVDLGLTIAIGMLADDALDTDMVAKLDDIDWRDWMVKHGARKTTVESPPIQLWYMAMAAYDQGSYNKPVCAAGASLACLIQLVLDYEGAISFQLANEVGDSVIGPITAALEHRGVKFGYFHRIWDLIPEGDGVGRVVMERQAEVRGGPFAYQPFFAPVNDRPVWPDVPNADQLAKVYVDERHPDLPAEDRRLDNFWCPRSGPDVVLERGRDYDELVLALGGPTLKWYLKRLAANRSNWQNLVDNVKGVETQGLRIWFLPTLEQTGWTLGPPVLSGYVLPYATWEDPSPVLASETWPDPAPQTVCHLFGPIEFGTWPDPTDWKAGNAYLRAQQARADVQARQWTSTQIAPLWPNCTLPDNPDGLDLSTCAREPQVRANSGPTQAYLWLQPGTWQARFAPGKTDVDGFWVCGDWTTTHFPCGSIEAAISSGFACGAAMRSVKA